VTLEFFRAATGADFAVQLPRPQVPRVRKPGRRPWRHGRVRLVREGGTRRVHLVREGGGGGARPPRLDAHREVHHEARASRLTPPHASRPQAPTLLEDPASVSASASKPPGGVRRPPPAGGVQPAVLDFSDADAGGDAAPGADGAVMRTPEGVEVRAFVAAGDKMGLGFALGKPDEVLLSGLAPRGTGQARARPARQHAPAPPRRDRASGSRPRGAFEGSRDRFGGRRAGCSRSATSCSPWMARRLRGRRFPPASLAPNSTHTWFGIAPWPLIQLESPPGS
jgi:hypothetical protein